MAKDQRTRKQKAYDYVNPPYSSQHLLKNVNKKKTYAAAGATLASAGYAGYQYGDIDEHGKVVARSKAKGKVGLAVSAGSYGAYVHQLRKAHKKSMGEIHGGVNYRDRKSSHQGRNTK